MAHHLALEQLWKDDVLSTVVEAHTRESVWPAPAAPRAKPMVAATLTAAATEANSTEASASARACAFHRVDGWVVTCNGRIVSHPSMQPLPVRAHVTKSPEELLARAVGVGTAGLFVEDLELLVNLAQSRLDGHAHLLGGARQERAVVSARACCESAH